MPILAAHQSTLLRFHCGHALRLVLAVSVTAGFDPAMLAGQFQISPQPAMAMPGSVLGYLAISAVLAASIFAVIFCRTVAGASQARKQAEDLASQLALVNDQMHDQARRIEELAMTRERNRLAREIHDSLGHYLTAISVQLEVARMVQAADPARALRAVTRAHSASQEALSEVRRSLNSLETDRTTPLMQRLRELTELDVSTGPSVNFKTLGEPRRLAAEVEHGLYRTVQEGLTNIRKHAFARKVVVLLDYRHAGRVEVCIEDDGRGASGQNGGGYGLAGLRERMALLGGKVMAGNRDEGGFSLRIEVPA